MKNIKIQFSETQALIACEVPNEACEFRLAIPYHPAMHYSIDLYRTLKGGRVTKSCQHIIEYIKNGNPKFNYKILGTNRESTIHSLPIQLSVDAEHVVYILETKRI